MLPSALRTFNSRALTRSLQSPVEIRARSVLIVHFSWGKGNFGLFNEIPFIEFLCLSAFFEGVRG